MLLLRILLIAPFVFATPALAQGTQQTHYPDFAGRITANCTALAREVE